MDALRKEIRTSEGFYNGVDGLMDIALGSAFLVATVSVLTGIVLYTSWFYLFLILIIRFLRTRVTHPRIGCATYKATSENLQKGLVLSSIAGLVVLGLFLTLFLLLRNGLSDGARRALSTWLPVLVGAFIATAVMVSGRIFLLKRFYAYGPLILVSFLLIPLVKLENTALISLICCGLVILITGVIVLFRFIRSYPVLEGEHE